MNKRSTTLLWAVLLAPLTLATPITYVDQTFTSALIITTPYDTITLTNVTFSGAFKFSSVTSRRRRSSPYTST